MQELLLPIRWLHVFSATAWFGEVVVINLVLIPVLGKVDLETKRKFVGTVFPRLFTLASFLSATAVITGGITFYNLLDGDYGRLTDSRWGLAILVGGSMAITLTLFHFFMENRLAKMIGIGCDGKADDVLNDVHLRLKIVPRVGLLVIGTIVFSMMFAVRGV